MKTPRLLVLFVVMAVIGGGGAALILSQRNPILVSEVVGVVPEGTTDEIRVLVGIENAGGPDHLIGVRSARALNASFSSGITGGIPVPAVDTVALAMDSVHVRLHGFKVVPRPGELVPIELTFARAGKVTTRVRMSESVTQGEASRVGLFGLGDICRVGEGEIAPQVDVEVTSEGDGYRVVVLTDDFEFTEHLVDGPHIPGTGHGHLYLGGAKLQRLYSSTALIGELPPGRHEVRVTLNTNDHRAYVVGDTPVSAVAEIIVE